MIEHPNKKNGIMPVLGGFYTISVLDTIPLVSNHRKPLKVTDAASKKILRCFTRFTNIGAAKCTLYVEMDLYERLIEDW